MSLPRTCVDKDGRFIVGIHNPCFHVKNLRGTDSLQQLGQLEDGTPVENTINFPKDDLYEPRADRIYEIANPFPFRGATFINSAWADQKAEHPENIRIDPRPDCSLLGNTRQAVSNGQLNITDQSDILDLLPHPLLIALAQASTDPEELKILARKSCRIIFDKDTGKPVGIRYKKNKGKIIPDILNHELFEVLVNNRCLPNDYKNTLVLKPGVQGGNEITGEYRSDNDQTHVFEYLRRNSYIPWGHFASNMANDAIRYRARDLDLDDMTGIRHLYYQRAYVRLAQQLELPLPETGKGMNEKELESIRQKILAGLKTHEKPMEFNATLWGWNYGFGYAQSGHRLHASHQMIHQQNAMIPSCIDDQTGHPTASFACGDLVHDFITQYESTTGRPFFDNYIRAIKENLRTDGRSDRPADLILMEDDHTLLFVPKAQICEWELQLITKTPCGNILEADTATRKSLDNAILTAVKTLDLLGAQLVTSIEMSKRISIPEKKQHLIYAFIPRLPYAPDTFSEAQLRWISGCYPEDVARACRRVMEQFIS